MKNEIVELERSTESLTIRMKPSVKLKLEKLASNNRIGLAKQIEKMILKEF